MIRDFNIEWLEKRIYIPAQTFQGQVTGAFIGAGAVVFQEISTFDFSGAQINQAADAIGHTMMIPYDLDRNKQCRFRVWWTKASVDADVETATLLYSVKAEGAALAAPATALSTAIPAYTFGVVSGAVEATSFGIINRGTFADTDAWISFNVASTMTTASANEISILGLEWRYSARRTIGLRRNVIGGRRLVAGRPLGVQLHASQEGL